MKSEKLLLYIDMEIPLAVALVPAVSAIVVAGLTYVFTKRREQEVEWRKLKLEHYRTFMSALSTVVGSRSTPESRAHYADAVNTMQLVAPEPVLAALYNFQEVIKYSNKEKSVDSHDEALTKLLHAMRSDVHPLLKSRQTLRFRLLDVPLTQEQPK